MMIFLVWLIATLAGLGYMVYQRAALIKTSGLLVGLFVVGQIAGLIGPVLWFLLLVILVPLNIPVLRQKLITSKLLTFYQSVMPTMSETEKDAINAGTVWWEGDLFRGAPEWSKLHQFSKPSLTIEEQAFLDGPVEEACKMCDDWQLTHALADMPPELWQYLKDQKFFAMIIEKEYGGLEFSAFAQSCVLQKLAGVSTVLASTVGVPNSLGPGELLQLYGTKAQKDYYLPRLATGEEVPCFALTSPEAGSDAGSIPDTGIVCKGQWNGQEIVGIKLNFDKRYITLAPVATVIGLAFKLYDPDGLLGNDKSLGITAALIPRQTAGVEIGRRHLPLNVPFMNGPVKGKDVFVPLDFIIGGQDMAGKGWRMLVECLSVGRAITLPSNSAGGVKTMALATGAYARVRRQFNLPIGKMEGVEEALARIGGNAYLMDAVTRLSTTGIDAGEKPSVISAISKYHMTEKLRSCMDDAMDVHGGKGICLGPNNYLGRGYQGVPVAITVEGANILTRSMIIYGQGAIRCHPYLLAEMEASAKEGSEALIEFDTAIFGHIGFALSNFVRSLFFGFGGYRFSQAPYDDSTRIYYQQMNRFSANLALLSDIAMGMLGGTLKRKERVSARLGDMLSYLYIGSAILKKYQDEQRPEDNLPLVHWGMQDTLFRLQEAQLELLDNFGNVGSALKYLMYPLGRIARRPDDKTDHQIADLLINPSDTRTRLGAGQFLAVEGLHGQLENTFNLMVKAEPLHQKVCDALRKPMPFTRLDEIAEQGRELGVLTDDEVKLLKDTEKGRLQVINVDDFEHVELMAGEAARKFKGDSSIEQSNKATAKSPPLNLSGDSGSQTKTAASKKSKSTTTATKAGTKAKSKPKTKVATKSAPAAKKQTTSKTESSAPSAEAAEAEANSAQADSPDKEQRSETDSTNR